MRSLSRERERKGEREGEGEGKEEEVLFDYALLQLHGRCAQQSVKSVGLPSVKSVLITWVRTTTSNNPYHADVLPLS